MTLVSKLNRITAAGSDAVLPPPSESVWISRFYVEVSPTGATVKQRKRGITRCSSSKTESFHARYIEDLP